jgi:hypothetical protein
VTARYELECEVGRPVDTEPLRATKTLAVQLFDEIGLRRHRLGGCERITNVVPGRRASSQAIRPLDVRGLS